MRRHALRTCGGGSLPSAATSTSTSTTSAPAASPAPATTQVVGIKVIDGAIANALVFLEKNGNGMFDPSEPNGCTDAQGKVTLQLAPEDVASSPVLALVGTDAVDADTGPVPVAFFLSAPADSTGVISPLSTLVQRVVAGSGVSTAQANTTLQGQAGVAVQTARDASDRVCSPPTPSCTTRPVPPLSTRGNYTTGSAPACGLQEVCNGASYASATLEELVSTPPRTPCIYATGQTAGSGGTIYTGPNDWWDQSTVNLGTIGTAAVVATPSSYFTGNTVLRLGFPAGGSEVVNYYSCSQRQVSGASVACQLVGTGSYAIQTLGDGRVLTFTNAPAQAAGLSDDRIFVERAGAVYCGYQTSRVSRLRPD